MKLCVIANPTAGAGRAGRRIPVLQRALSGSGLPGRIAVTGGPGDATRLAREARSEGVSLIAVLGGDGTLHEVAQAYIDERGAALPGPDLTLLPAGTGSDFARTLNAPRDLQEALNALRDDWPSQPVDLGVAESPRGEAQPFAFVNELSFGLPGWVARTTRGPLRRLGGRTSYYLTTLHALLTRRACATEVFVDGQPWLSERAWSVTVANGRFFGGSMLIAPRADPSDGELDVVAAGDVPRLRMFALSRRIYAGTHLESAGISATRGTSVEARAMSPTDLIPVEADGEACGQLPIRIRVLSTALRLRAWPASSR